MKKRFLPILLMATISFLACSGNEKVENIENTPLEYFYIDATNILHIDNKCENICETTYGTKPVSMYPVSQIYYVEYNSICATCVDAKYYDELHINTTNNLKKYYNIARNIYSDVRNSNYEVFVKYLENNAKAFYDDLSKQNHDGSKQYFDGNILPPYHEFCREISHPNQIATDNQRKVYNALCEKHSGIFDDFNEFQSIISDTNTLRVYYDKLKQDDIPFLPSFESFVVDLGLDPNQPAQLKLLI